jgi:hypothetical protein
MCGNPPGRWPEDARSNAFDAATPGLFSRTDDAWESSVPAIGLVAPAP